MRGRGDRWWRLGPAVVGLVVLIGLAVLWVQAPIFYPPPADGRAPAIATTRTGIVIAGAALIIFVGLMMSLAEIRRAATRATERDRQVAERQLAGQLIERYTRAVNQLGSDTADVRLGGIYALERLAGGFPEEQPAVVEMLSAFVREHTRLGRPGNRRCKSAADGPETDIQAAINVLGRLPARDGVLRADLTGADLAGARLDRANFTRARLDGVNLAGARLVEANLTRAGLVGVNLRTARLDGADLTGALLDRANLTDARLEGADLTGAWLDGVDLTGAVPLTQEQLEVAHGDAATVLPVGFTRPTSWPEAITVLL